MVILRFFISRTKPAGWDGRISSIDAGLSMRALKNRRSFWYSAQKLNALTSRLYRLARVLAIF